MKKSILSALALLLMGTGLFAQTSESRTKGTPTQGERRPQMSADDRAKQATDKINGIVQLSVDQYQKVLAVNKEFFTQRAALKAQKGGDDAAMKSKMGDLSKDRKAKIKAILTPEQLKKWEENKKEEGDDHPAPMGK